MTLRTFLLAGLVAGALGAVPVLAAPSPPSRGDEAAVIRSFRSVLNRDPHPYELRRYALLVDDYGWTEQDVRRDLGERTDYRRYSTGSTYDLNAVITRAYEDILGRPPDPRGMQEYRRQIVQHGWTEQDVREALRQSPEYRSRRTVSADRIVRRAYQDVLKREPDPSGRNTYRRAILEHGWDEQDVRQALRRSSEFRGHRGGDAVTQVVRRAYLAVLRREPDANGLRDYGARVVQDHWDQADIERALRDSPEYHLKHR